MIVSDNAPNPVIQLFKEGLETFLEINPEHQGFKLQRDLLEAARIGLTTLGNEDINGNMNLIKKWFKSLAARQRHQFLADVNTSIERIRNEKIQMEQMQQMHGISPLKTPEEEFEELIEIVAHAPVRLHQKTDVDDFFHDIISSTNPEYLY